MGKRDELIAQYADDLKNKCGIDPDMDLPDKGHHRLRACDL